MPENTLNTGRNMQHACNCNRMESE